ncbi:GntR family transcriptional regulator [Deinococcus sp. Arct2-2]|uniref:GntR family transcriptional regulator n=1 Tax=Deinococcus sp. Arct2-2 TaxID=2568653 RepID=UPI0010A2AFE9|nr:GntR family transcriptional regulator [Deinococcus sp. Arct2-2]THF69708.1 GntR family transcriptional regulator [Deinococcus sp. Arct2-2]
MPLPESPKVPRLLARDEVYARLRDWIVLGTLSPGEVLRDQDIAAQLGLSRTPVREALRRLEDEGFVETAMNRWTRVAPLDISRAAELYPVIESLELLALDRAAPHLGPEAVRHLEQANATLSAALAARDAAGALAADDAFHGVWIELAGNRALADTLAQLKVKLRRVELAYFDHEARSERSLAEHALLVEAVRGNQWKAARTLLKRNWRGSLERLLAQESGAQESLGRQEEQALPASQSREPHS